MPASEPTCERESAGDCNEGLGVGPRTREAQQAKRGTCLSLAFKSPCPDLIPKGARPPGFGVGGYHPSAVVQKTRLAVAFGAGKRHSHRQGWVTLSIPATCRDTRRALDRSAAVG